MGAHALFTFATNISRNKKNELRTVLLICVAEKSGFLAMLRYSFSQELKTPLYCNWNNQIMVILYRNPFITYSVRDENHERINLNPIPTLSL